MDRVELERLDRENLISRAEDLGVVRANVLTRPELVDEILLRTARQATDPASVARARGWFGRARDLLARVIERGLHLPDAAERVRALAPPVNRGRSAPTTVPTVTLAEIYAAQGHKEKALETLRRVLKEEPEHAAARALLNQLQKTDLPPPPLPPEEEAEASANGVPQNGAPPAASDSDKRADDPEKPAAPAEPFGMLDDQPLPPKYDVDECVAIPVDPRTMFVYWEVRDDTLAYLKRTHRDGQIALRVLIIEPTWDGPRTYVRDHVVNAQVGDYFIRDLPLGCVVRAGLGWREGDAFVSVAHSPTLEVPPGAASPILAESLVRWTTQGIFAVDPDEEGAESIRRAMGRAHHQVQRARVRGDFPRGAAGAEFFYDGALDEGDEGAEGAERAAERPLGSSENALRKRGAGGRAETSSESMLR
ncbi:DUF4912 domain-containing protein [Pendulispora albinea]|uniref:DUF4912 domain-containing protein n=1 Tax=Pendulispora albinea TaxID=2741071 RepID=A0ABZ2M427_9BACT